MPQLRGFLDRFRLAGTPGAAARSSVPADRSRQLAAEVGPVLALLDEADEERARIAARAKRDADQIMAAARAEAAAITADAGGRAKAAREAAERQLLAAARGEAAAAAATAAREAAATRELAWQRMPTLVDRAIGLIWQLRTDDR